MSSAILTPDHQAGGSRCLVFVAVAIFIVVAWFGSLELRGLFFPDEGRYAEIPREMLASGDLVTPRLNDLKYFEKPPLQYWMTAASFRVFGEDEWTARLPATLLGFLALLVVGFTGYRLWGARAGLVAAVMLSGSWGYFLGSQYVTLDMTVTSCLTMALCAFLLAQQESVVPRQRAWTLAAWAAAALAVLAKGLIGIVLPGLALAAYVALRREWGLLKRLHPFTGGIVFLLISGPWFILVQQRNPEFFDFFFIRQHFQRFATPIDHRPGAWWYYLPVLVMGLLPWSPALLKTGIDWLRERRERDRSFSAAAFCLVWASVVLLFFSASHSKLPGYILPAFPAVVLAFASRFRRGGTNSLEWSAWGVTMFAMLLLGLIPLLPNLEKFSLLGRDAASHLTWFYGAAGLLLASGTVALWSARRGLFAATVVILIAGTFGFWQLVFGFLHEVDASLSSEKFIEALTSYSKPFQPGTPFYSVDLFDDSVPFYLGRAVTLVNVRGELGPGIDAEPEKAIASLADFKRIWTAQPGQAYAIMSPRRLQKLQDEGLPMKEVLSNERLVVVARQAGRH